MYRIKLTVIVSASNQADALKRLADRIEPEGKREVSNGMYIDTTDKIEELK